MADQRGSHVAFAGKQRDRIRRDAAGSQRLDQPQRAAGGLLGRLEHRGVAGGQRRRRHPAGNGQGKVPGRDHRRDPAGHVAQLVAFTRDLDHRTALLELNGPARVVLEEVDRLADIGIGLGPGLRALADLERGQFQAPLAHPGGGARQSGSPVTGGDLAPDPNPPGGRLERRANVGLRRGLGPGDEPLRVTGIRRIDRSAGASARVGADHHRHLKR